MKSLLTAICYLLLLCNAHGQTCCSGGVPLSGNIGLPLGSKGTWQFSMTYDINVLRNLLEGSTQLEDKARERRTQSILVQMGYTINNRWSLDLFTSLVNQQRTINHFAVADHVSTSGLGDAAILLKYNTINPELSNFQVTVAAGPKLPTGKSDLRREDGIPLIADLQPGSGALDAIFWTNAQYTLNFRSSLKISSTFIYSYKGQNNQYLGNQSYKFGNEFQALIAISDYFLLFEKLLDISLACRLRAVERDQYNELEMPNTGGRWLFLTPGFAYNLGTKVALNASFEVPLYSFVQGIQLSPSFRLNSGLFIKINKKPETLKI